MIRLLVRCLATWRITELVTTDEISRPARDWVAKRWPGSKAAYLVTCPRCVSVWAALAVAVLPEWACRVLASSSVTILLGDVRDHAAQSALTARMAAASGGVQRAREAAD